LLLVTFGLYSSIWYIRRTPFVNGLRSVSKLHPAMPWALFAFELGGFLVIFLPKEYQTTASGIGALILSLLVRFRIADIRGRISPAQNGSSRSRRWRRSFSASFTSSG
jgi:hypothetical protein